MAQVLNLYRLQKIDSRRDQISTRLAEIDKIMSENAELREAQEQSGATQKAEQIARKQVKSLEEAVEAQQIKIEENSSALYGGRIRNPKELQDLQNEVASLKRHLATIEDQQLEALIALEACEVQNKAAQDHLQAVQAKSISNNSSLVGEQTTLRKEKERQETERQAVVASIPADTLKLYERLRQQKRGLAVTTAADAACDACGATLTQADWQLARSPGQISFCPSCGRILYAG